jgi:hypothetical protein
MKPRGEDVASAVRDWLKDDLKGVGNRRYDLGKFFFGVSTGTAGLFATLFKFAVEHPTLNDGKVICFLALLVSALLGLWMALPTIVRIDDQTNLYTEYESTARSTLYLTVGWVMVWLLGFVFGLAELF